MLLKALFTAAAAAPPYLGGADARSRKRARDALIIHCGLCVTAQALRLDGEKKKAVPTRRGQRRRGRCTADDTRTPTELQDQ